MIARIVHLALAALLAVPLMAAPAATPPRKPVRIIDAHVHPEFEGQPERQRKFMKEWEEAGLTAAVGILHTHDGRLPDINRNLIYCAGLVGPIDVQKLEAELENRTYRCIKVYLGYEPYWASDPRYEPVYALAEKYDVPVVFHTGDTDSTKALLKYADPLTVDEVAVAHPRVRFVLAHCGNPWIESAAEVAYKNPNVYLDGSAFLTGDLRKQPRSKVDRYMVRPLAWIFGYVEDPKKLMFGSDWPITNIPSAVEAFKRAIPQEYWDDVFYMNAVRVFHFTPGQPQSK